MESVHEQCVQALALQLAGLRPRQINALLGTVPTPSELPLGYRVGLTSMSGSSSAMAGRRRRSLGDVPSLVSGFISLVVPPIPVLYAGVSGGSVPLSSIL